MTGIPDKEMVNMCIIAGTLFLSLFVLNLILTVIENWLKRRRKK